MKTILKFFAVIASCTLLAAQPTDATAAAFAPCSTGCAVACSAPEDEDDLCNAVGCAGLVCSGTCVGGVKFECGRVQ